MTSENCKVERRDLVWTIKNCINHPGGEICKVIFEAGNPSHSLYYIKIYIHVTKTGKQALSHKLVFLKGSYQKGHTCRVCIVSKDGKAKPLPIFNPRTTNCHILEENFYSDGSVTLRCKLTFLKESLDYTSRVKEQSKKISVLREMKEFSDLVLCAKSGEEFYVNRFLLRKRCPKFLEHFEINGEERAKVNISLPVLNALLQYVYSGKYEDLPVENVKEFYEIMAEICQYEEFTNEIFKVKLPVNLCSDIKIIKKKVYLNISVKDAVKRKVPFIKPVLLDSDRFFVEVFLKKVISGISVDTRIRCGELQQPISFDCVSSMTVDQNDLEIQDEVIRLRFSPKDKEIEKRVSTFVLKKKVHKESYLLMCLDMAYTKGETTCSIEDIDLQYRFMYSDSWSVFGMGLLCQDLFDLCHETRAADGDIKLIFEDGELGAHKAILAASSPLFYEIFQTDSTENNSGEVKIEGIDIKCGKRLLEYMYTREVNKNDYESDLGFLYALNRYQVSPSFENASVLHVSRLTDTNACGVLIEANRCNNKKLMKDVVEYICLNRNVIMCSSPWASLIGTHKELVSMVLQNLPSIN